MRVFLFAAESVMFSICSFEAAKLVSKLESLLHLRPIFLQMRYIIELILAKDLVTSDVFDSVIIVSLRSFTEANMLENFNGRACTIINRLFLSDLPNHPQCFGMA